MMKVWQTIEQGQLLEVFFSFKFLFKLEESKEILMLLFLSTTFLIIIL
jgi:hypothetical protein